MFYFVVGANPRAQTRSSTLIHTTRVAKFMFFQKGIDLE